MLTSGTFMNVNGSEFHLISDQSVPPLRIKENRIFNSADGELRYWWNRR